MSDKINKNIRYYLPNDPYYYEVDNLPLQDLLDNDDRLQIQLDQIKAQIDITQGRGNFAELKPYVNTGDPGRVFVNPGNFLARIDSASDRYTGLQETEDFGNISNPTHPDGVKTVDAESNAQWIASGTARTSLVRLYKNADGTNPSVPITAGEAADYPSTTNSLPPAYRLDLVYVRANPAEDQDNGTPSLGVARGAYFIRGDGGSASRSGSQLQRYADVANNKDPRTMIQDVNDVPPELIAAKVNPADGKALYTTVPTIDILDSKFGGESPASRGDGASININDIVDYVTAQQNYSFGLPVCYVLVPFNYIEGTALTEDNLIDIRPFFRTNELTLSERQAIATADQPSLLNPFVTQSGLRKNMGVEIARNPNRSDIQTQIYEVESAIPTFSATQDYAVYGKISPIAFPEDTAYMGNYTNPVYSHPVSVGRGTYLIWLNFFCLFNYSTGNLKMEIVNEQDTVVYGELVYHGGLWNADDDGFACACILATIPTEGVKAKIKMTGLGSAMNQAGGAWGRISLYDSYGIFLSP